MSRISWAVLCLGIWVVVTPGDGAYAGRRNQRRARSAPARTAPQVPVQASPAVPAVSIPREAPTIRIDPEQAMADILALRAAQTGSILSDDGEFTEALQRVIAQKQGQAIVPPERPASAAVSSGHGSLESLRISARHFEERAADLEAEKAYAEADSARATAADLWREARRLDP